MALLRKEPSDRPTARQALERLNVNTDFRVQAQEFIGRVGARRTLHEAIEETRNGTGRIVVVEGDSGLGKTALVENFGHEARLLGATIFTGTCVQRDHVPMRGLDTLVERLAEAYRKETARVLRRLDEGERAAIINGFGFLGELLPQEEHGTDDGRSSAASGLHRWLSALASTRLLVLVIEHLHLADDEVCDILENLLSGGEPPPVLVILTVRSDRTMTGDRLSDLLDFLYTRQQTRRIALDPFSLPEVRQYLREHMRPTPHWLAEYILDETEGNPLFVSAMVEALKTDVDSPPPSLKETVRRQLEGLGQDARALLCALALNGEPISVATVCDAAGLESDRAYDALRILSAEDIADLETMGDGRAFVAGAHEPLLALVRTHVDEPQTWHRRLAGAHQKNQGPAHLIEYHWRQADDVEQASLFARQEAERARADGIHPRAVEMIRLSLSLAAPEQERTELYTNLVDSLARCGRHAEAADAIGDLEAFDPDMAYLLRGRRCHFHLLAGHLAEFERHAIELPRRAHVPLAGALVEFLPDKAAEYVRHGDDVWAHLVQIQLLAQSSRDDDHRRAKKLLQDCDQSVTDEGPEWAGEYALACVHYMRAVGASNAAVDLIQKTLEEIGEHRATDTLLTSRLQLLLGQALLDGGHVSAARREVGHLLRMARKRNLSSIRALASILQSRATLAGGDTRVADAFIEEAGRHWPAEPASVPHARLAIARAHHALVEGRIDRAEDILSQTRTSAPLNGFLHLRSLSLELVLLETRIFLYRELRRWRDNAENLSQNVDGLLHSLARLRPLPSGWITGVKAVVMANQTKTQTALDSLATRLNGDHGDCALVRSVLLGIRSFIRFRMGRGGRKNWAAALDALRAVGAAIPPELQVVNELWKSQDDGGPLPR